MKSAFDANNPDHLVALISVLEGEDRKTDYEVPQDPKSSDKSGAILDSLAHLAICRESGQTISIGVVQVGKTLELVVAENGPVDLDVISFLVAFTTSLSDIRRRLASPIVKGSISALSEGSPPSSTSDSTSTDNQQLAKELHALKSVALLHNLPQIRKRFLKNYPHFQSFFDHFEQNAHHDQMEGMSDMLNSLEELLRILGMALNRLTLTEGDAGALRMVLLIIQSIDQHCVKDSNMLYHCTKYIKDTPSLQPKFNVTHWLKKLTSNLIHLVRIAHLATSRYMTDFLVSPPRITPLDNEILSSSFSITRKAFVDLLKGIPWTPHEDKGLSEDEIFDTMCANFKHTHPSNVDEKLAKRGTRIHCLDDEIQFEVKSAVHAECVVLEHLTTRQAAMPLIGVSKLSCTACHLYHNLLPFPFRTTGTHSLFPPTWTCPTDVQETRLDLCKLLLTNLEERARRLETKILRERYEQTPEYAHEQAESRARHEIIMRWALDAKIEAAEAEANRRRGEIEQAASVPPILQDSSNELI